MDADAFEIPAELFGPMELPFAFGPMDGRTLTVTGLRMSGLDAPATEPPELVRVRTADGVEHFYRLQDDDRIDDSSAEIWSRYVYDRSFPRQPAYEAQKWETYLAAMEGKAAT